MPEDNNTDKSAAQIMAEKLADELSSAPPEVQTKITLEAYEAKQVLDKLRYIQSDKNKTKPRRVKFFDWMHLNVAYVLDRAFPDIVAESYLARIVNRRQKKIFKMGKYLTDISTSELMPEDIASVTNMTASFLGQAIELSIKADEVLVYDHTIKAIQIPTVEAITKKFDTRMEMQGDTSTPDDNCQCEVCKLRRSLLGTYDPKAGENIPPVDPKRKLN